MSEHQSEPKHLAMEREPASVDAIELCRKLVEVHDAALRLPHPTERQAFFYAATRDLCEAACEIVRDADAVQTINENDIPAHLLWDVTTPNEGD